MGNALHKVAEATTPFMDKTPILGKNADLAQDLLKPKTGAPPPAYNPANNPGTHLYPQPSGGPPSAPGGAPGGAGSGLFGPQTPQPGYAPNLYQAASGAQPGAGGPSGMWLGRGGSSSGAPGGPPPMANVGQGMDPNLQKQLMMAQMLRGPQVRQQ